MKNVKKLLSILMVLTLVLALGASALAVDITVNEKDGESTGGEYSAYKLLNLTTSENADPTDDDYTETGYSYTVNGTYRTALMAVTKAEDDEGIIEYIKNLTTADAIREFADAMYEQVKDMSADKTTTTGTFEGVDQGYYLIVETKAAEDEDGIGVKSKVILDTAGQENIAFETKEEKPSSKKEVQDINDSTETAAGAWAKSADYDIGDSVPFKLTGTLPEDYDDYTNYVVTFHDSEGTGLAFEGITSVTVGSITLTAGQYTLNQSPEDDCTFEITINVKSLGATIAALGGSRDIVVEYTSELLATAVVGNPGNPNDMYMQFTNDHYGEDTGTTPVDKVVVFTYELDTTKVGPDGEETLEGAGFALLKEDAAHASDDLAETKWEDLKNQPADTYVKYNGKVYKVVKVYPAGDTTVFGFKGIDDGNYLLVETEVPDGYNKADDIPFTVAADHVTLNAESGYEQVTNLTANGADVEDLEKPVFSVNIPSGMISNNVVNNTGLELPETGGIGTTIFYVAGAVLVAGAVILLVTRKRMSGAEK